MQYSGATTAPSYIGEVSAHWGLFLIYCNKCPHQGFIHAEVARQRFGAQTRIKDMKVRCAMCGGRYVTIRPYEELRSIPIEKCYFPRDPLSFKEK